MDAATEIGKNPVSKHQIQPEYYEENAQANNAGRGGQTRRARPNFLARTGTARNTY